MDPPTVTQATPGLAFAARGLGTHNLTLEPNRGPRVSGRQGTIDILLMTGPTIVAVGASGMITVVAGASLVDGETFTLNDGAHAAKVFEFDSNAAVTPGNVAVTFTGGDSVATIKAAVIAAINGAATLDITAAPGGTGEVLLVNDLASAAGNQSILDTVANPGFIVTGMAGGVTVSPARTICFLTDNPASPTNYIAIKLDSTNRPFVQMTNSLGTVVGVVTPSTPAIGPSRTIVIRFAWDSSNAVDVPSGRRASLRVDQELVGGGTWTTSPTSNWDSFQPTHLVLGGGIAGAADFNGSIPSVQVSNTVTV